MPAQQPDLGLSPSVQRILGCINQTIKSKHPKPESSLLMEHMWAGSRLCEASMFLELSPHSLGFHRPVFHCDSSSSGYPSLGGAARLIRHVRGPPRGCFCSLDVLFLFSDQCSTAVHSSYWVPLHLVPWSPFPRSSLCLWACLGIV